jgi:hypothetical protein
MALEISPSLLWGGLLAVLGVGFWLGGLVVASYVYERMRDD